MVGLCPKHNAEYNKWSQCPGCLREANKKYRDTHKDKERLRRKKYYNTPNGKATTSLSKKRYRSSERGLVSIRKYQTSEKRKEAEKQRATSSYGKLKRGAYNSVSRAINNGKLIKLPCLICGDPKTEAHHYLGYSEEHRLDVVFLCKEHHCLADHDSVFNEEIKSMKKAPCGAKTC